MKGIVTNVRVYRGFLVIDTHNGKEKELDPIDRFGTRIGHLLSGTKVTLGVSNEALEVLKKVKRKTEASEENMVNWCDSHRGEYLFSWVGGHTTVLGTEGLVGGSTYEVPKDDFILIDNKCHSNQAKIIDRILDKLEAS